MAERGEAGIAAVASAQAGLAHREQLLAVGISRGAIQRRLAKGLLYPVFPRLYGVGHRSLPELAPFVAAVLYTGSDAVLSHGAAAYLWGLIRAAPSVCDVTVVRRHTSSVPGLRAHRAARLVLADVRLRYGIPVTAPALTLLDLAGQSADGDTLAALAQARVLGLVRDRELKACLGRHPARTGAARLRRILGGAGGPALTRSEAERVFLRLVARAQLPPPEVNARVCGLEVDFVWRAARLVVEIDGRQFHTHPEAFEADRAPRPGPGRRRVPGPARDLASARRGAGGRGGTDRAGVGGGSPPLTSWPAATREGGTAANPTAGAAATLRSAAAGILPGACPTGMPCSRSSPR